MNTGSQILLNALSPDELIELLRPMTRQEIRHALSEQEEKLLSPAETCKLFNPAITKATQTSLTKQGLLREHRIGGRIFYRQSVILASTKKLFKYRSLY
jgi:hypothetical protein